MCLTGICLYLGNLKRCPMVKMVVTDLDGTLLDSNSGCSCRNLSVLAALGSRGITRVIATGRSPYSASRVLPDDFPIDYLVFSSGAGIMRWSDKSVIYATELPAAKVREVIGIFVDRDVDFMVQAPIPLNHTFHYHFSGHPNPDFDRRLAVYKGFCSPLLPGVPYPNGATQLVAILPPDLERFHSLERRLQGVKVIRATSPLDGESIWMEIFPEGVSKGHGAEWLCHFIGGVRPDEIVAVGNDYNDLDLLGYTPNSFLVANAPEELKPKFRVVASNNESGFAEAVGAAVG